MVKEIKPDYKPWFNAIWEPPSPEVESFLFAVQASIGAGFIGYWIGFQRGRRTTRSV
jgi:cobalt/nickel transport protein